MTKVIPPEIELINSRLHDYYGIHDNAQPHFRVVWSEDQYEYRHGTYDKFTEHDLWLGKETGVKYVPKYSQWIPNQWVLEKLCPTDGNTELVEKLSYEPLFPFRGLEPDWEVIKFIIDNLLKNQNRPKGIARYKPEFDELQTEEAREARIEKLEKYLFEDESNLTARLRFGEAVVNPGIPKVDNSKVDKEVN